MHSWGSKTATVTSSQTMLEVQYPLAYKTFALPMRLTAATATGSTVGVFTGLYGGSRDVTGFSTYSVGYNYGTLIWTAIGY